MSSEQPTASEVTLARHQVLKRLLSLTSQAVTEEDFVARALDVVLSAPRMGVEPRGAVFLTDAAGDLTMAAQRRLADEVRRGCTRVPSGTCLCGRAAQQKSTVIASHVDASHERFREQPDHGHVVAPLLAGPRSLGVLCLYLPAGQGATTDDVLFVESAAQVMALGLEHFAAQAASTERAALERRLIDDFTAVVQHAVDSVCIYGPDGKLLYANPSCVKVLGHGHLSELQGMKVKNYVHPDDRSKAIETVAKVWHSGTPSTPHEVRLLRRDGAEVVAEFIELKVVFSGKPAIVAMVRDLTERRTLAMRAMEVDRMVAVGTLATGVAHEINNPLAYVLANAGYVTQEFDRVLKHPDPVAVTEFRTALHDIERGAQRVRDIVADLKTLARPDSQTTRAADVKAVLDAAVSIARSEMLLRARLVQSYDGLPYVMGGRSRIGQVFVNLLVNAAHAIPEGAPERNEISIVGYTDKTDVVITVHDTGSGIAPEHLNRIFDPFFTTKPVGQGTGLGLSICRSIITSLGGTLTVSTAVGRGSSFTVRLPAHFEPVNDAGVLDKTPAPSRVTSARVLVVDDDPFVARALQRSLSSIYKVFTATSGGQALSLLSAGERFDAILCDLMMPSMTGMELLERILDLDRAQAARIVFMTAGAFTPEAKAFLERLKTHHLSKPFDAEEVSRSLEQIITTRGFVGR